MRIVVVGVQFSWYGATFATVSTRWWWSMLTATIFSPTVTVGPKQYAAMRSPLTFTEQNRGVPVAPRRSTRTTLPGLDAMPSADAQPARPA